MTAGRNAGFARSDANVATIVVVDDEPGLARVMSRALVGAGYRVVTCYSAEEALPALVEGAVDLLVTDVIMPGMNGFELAAHVRRVMPSLPIVVTSAHFDSAMAGSAPDDLVILDKPVRPVELIAVVREAIGDDAMPESGQRRKVTPRRDD